MCIRIYMRALYRNTAIIIYNSMKMNSFSLFKHICIYFCNCHCDMFSLSSPSIRIILTSVRSLSDELHRTDYANFTVGIGVHDIENPDDGYIVPVSKVILHEKFTSTYLHDINDLAILQLRYPIKFNDNVKPACLPSKGQHLLSFAIAYIHISVLN